MIILQVCAYSAEYPGNFLASLFVLEEMLQKQNIKTIYAFSEGAADRDWCKDIQKRTLVYFLPEAKARILPQTYFVFNKIYGNHDISIVHTHFELYDIPATITAKQSTRIFWHLHDPIQFKHNMRGLLWRFQYGIIGHRAQLLAVSDHYRKTVIAAGFPAGQTRVILNGIDLERIQPRLKKKSYDFLTFGWDFYRKGDDLILDACEKLAKEGYQFRLLLNGNEQTWHELSLFLQDRKPEWLVLGNPVSDVNSLFNDSRCFIQASRRETFSYAICEAAFAGLPVISSDIPGIEWAKELPSVSFFDAEDYLQLYSVMRSFLDGAVCNEEDLSKTKMIIKQKYSTYTWARQIMEIYFSNRKENEQ